MIPSSAVLEIDTNNLLHNYKYLASISRSSLTGATIKANAYGLGDIKVFKILYKAGCRHFFVATIQEAITIRNKYKGGFIYVLNGLNKKNIKYLFKEKNIIPIINSIESFNELQDNMKNIKKIINIGLHIDTGINRLGLNINELQKYKIDKKYKILIMLTHLASADEKNNNYNKIQNNNFKEAINNFNSIKLKSVANSMGIILGKSFHYDLTRAGISLYGGYFNSKLKNKIKPVVQLKAEILQIKKIKKNEYIGYNQTFRSKKNMIIAILGIGCADGVSRQLSNRGYVFYKNYRFNILGRISMDSITIDVSNHSYLLKPGMFVEIINDKYDIEKLAIKCGTISNEILTSISNRVKRVYI